MRILLDECFGASTRTALEALGADVKWIGDVGPGMSDLDVIALSVRERRLIIATDLDFRRLVFSDGEAFWGVLTVREGSAIGAEKSAVVSKIVTTQGGRLIGAMSTYRRGSLRISRPGLPDRDFDI